MNWNLYGKLSKVDQTALGRKINYSYDGLGNRVRKEIVSNVPGTGEVHEGEYYVRDASGNILATYRFKNIYDKISVIGIANNGSYSNPGFPPFVNGIGTPIGTFTSSFAAYANDNMPSWTETQIDRPASFFLTYDAGMYSEILAGGDPPDYMNDLQQYSSDNSTYQIFAAPLNDNPTEAGQIMWLVVQNEIEAKKMFELFDEYMPGADLDNMWTNLGVGSTRSTTDHVANAGTLYSYMTGGGHESEVLDEMATVIADNNANNSGEDAKNFFGAMMHDDVIYESTNLRSTGPPTDFETQIRGLLYMYGNMENITGFFDQWDYTNGWITTHSTPEHRMEVSYVNDANAVMEDFLNNVADVRVLDTLIANTDEISAYDYLLRRSDPDVISSLGPVDQASLYTYGTAIDTTDLAEHHIYGSSRLGVQNYLAGQYRQTYNVNGGVTPITALSTPAVWYSYAYSDLITAGQRSPYGNHHTDSMRVGRTLGYRNYEMTDHLGNVLASVLDRKTGVDTGTGSTHYAYYNPDMSSVQDYYPGGMRMGLRNSQVADSVYKFGYNGQMRDDDIAGAFKHNTALFWEYNPLLQIRWNRDQKPSTGLSPYSVFKNNPVRYTDPLGDTTRIHNLQGELIGTLNDGLINQVHFVDIKSKEIGYYSELINKANARDISERNFWAKYARKVSTAYIGSNTIAQAKALAKKSLQSGVEVGYFAYIGKGKELVLEELDPTYSDASTFDMRGAVGKMSDSWRTSAFGFGHSHFENYKNNSKVNSTNSLIDLYGKPTFWTFAEEAFNSGPRDINGFKIGHDYQDPAVRQTPLFIITPISITIYNSEATNKEQQSRLHYDWFKAVPSQLLNKTFKLD